MQIILEVMTFHMLKKVMYSPKYLMLIPGPVNITSKRLVRHDCYIKLYQPTPSLIKSDITTRDPSMSINNKDTYLSDLQDITLVIEELIFPYWLRKQNFLTL